MVKYTDTEVHLRAGPASHEAVFTFDRVFGEDRETTAPFDMMKESVELAVCGFNALILTYGQAGSGKTTTLWSDLIEPTLAYIPDLLTPDVALISAHFLKIEGEKCWNLLGHRSAANLVGKDIFVRSAMQLGNEWNIYEVSKVFESAKAKLMDETTVRAHYVIHISFILESGKLGQI
jgi:hypothetical protein